MRAIVIFIVLICTPAFIQAQRSLIFEQLENSNEVNYLLSRGSILCSNKAGNIVRVRNSKNCDTVELSTDNGDSWEPVFKGDSTLEINNVRISDDNTIIFTANIKIFVNNKLTPAKGIVFRSDKLGSSWDSVILPDLCKITKMDMYDSNCGAVFVQNVNYPVDSSYILYTADSWKSTIRIANPSSYVCSGLWTPASRTILFYSYFSKKENKFLKSTNLGTSWMQSNSSVPEGIRDLCFIDSATVWAAGGQNNGIGQQRSDLIIKSENGGLSWKIVMNSEVVQIMGLEYIKFRNKQYGLAAGKNDKLYLTTDSGKTWQRQDMPCNADWWSNSPQIAFIRDSRIFLLSGYSCFRSIDRTALKAPFFISPLIDTTEVDDVIDVKWTEIDSAKYYELQLSSVFTFPDTLNTITGIVSASHKLQLEYNKKYYIRVRAMNDNDSSQWSEIVFIKTKLKEGSLNVPVFIYPKNWAVNVETNPQLKWYSVPGATRYHLQMADRDIIPGVQLLIDNDNITDTTLQLENLKNNQYYFTRIRCLNAADSSKWNVEIGLGLRFTTGPNDIADESENPDSPHVFYENNCVNISGCLMPIDRLRLFNITGEAVFDSKKDVSATSERNRQRFYTGKLSNGVYFALIESGRTEIVRRFTVAE